MGIFAPLSFVYIVFSLVFMLFAVGFVAFDKKCKTNRIAWAFLTLFTGPIGLFIYLYRGRIA